MVPNGVGTGRPPAKALPPRTVWQSLQLPSAARSRPLLTRAGSNDCGAGGSIADIAGRQATANAATTPLSTSAITTPAIIFVRVIRPYSFGMIANTSRGATRLDHRVLTFVSR